MATALGTTPEALSLPGDATGTATVAPGGNIDYQLQLDVNLDTLASDVLTNTIVPLIANPPQSHPVLAASAALNLRITDLTASIPIPTETVLVGTPTVVTSAGGPASTVTNSAGSL